MLVIYWITLLTLGVYFFRRRFDIFTLAFLSCGVYFIPAAVPIQSLPLGAYAIYLAVLVLVAAAAAIFDNQDAKRKVAALDLERMKVYYRGVLLICLPTLIAFVATRGDVVPTTKGEGGGLLYYFFSAILGYLFVLSLGLRKKIGLAISLGSYAWFVFTGDRTQFVIAVLAAAIFFFVTYSLSPRTMLRRARPYQLLLVAALVFVGLFGKNVYGAYYDSQAGGDFWTSFNDRFRDMAESPSSRFEPYHVQSILDMAIESDDRIDSDYLWWAPVQLLPFAGDLGSDVHDQSEAVKELYFSNWSDKSGVSSNFFAEGYLLWGYAGALLFAALYALLLFLFAVAMRRGSLVARLWLCYGAVFWAFYLHRSSLLQIISHEKRIIYSMLLVLVVSKMLHTLRKFASSTRPVAR